MSRSGFGAALLLIVPVVALRLEQRVLPKRAGSCYFGSGVLFAAPVVGGVSREATMQEYRNDKIVVRYDPKTCIHAGDCVRGLPKVFESGRSRGSTSTALRWMRSPPRSESARPVR